MDSSPGVLYFTKRLYLRRRKAASRGYCLRQLFSRQYIPVTTENNMLWGNGKSTQNWKLFQRIVNIWNSLPNSVVDASTANAFKARLDKFLSHQAVKYDFTADLTGNRSKEVLKSQFSRVVLSEIFDTFQ